VITVGGTVLANLLTVLVVGAALILARVMKEAHLGVLDWVQLGLAPVAGLLLLVLTWLVGTGRARPPGSLSAGSTPLRLHGRGHIVGLLAMVILIALVWVGMASGLAG
jgi:Na+/proline symporter